MSSERAICRGCYQEIGAVAKHEERVAELEAENERLRGTIDHILNRMRPLLPVFAAMLDDRNIRRAGSNVLDD